MKIIYQINVNRNKFKYDGYDGVTATTLKKKLIKQEGKKCYICKNHFNYVSQLELEHLIPVMVGGHLFESKNINLCCSKCHRKKTSFDVRAIFILRKLGLIKGNYIMHFYKPRIEIIKLYKQILKILKETDLIYTTWDYGESNKDYEIIDDKNNRQLNEVENGKQS